MSGTFLKNPFKAKLFSAWGFAWRAMLILAVFAILHLAGLREYTSFITGTTSGNFSDILGMAYFIFYSLSIFVAPVLLLGSIFTRLLSLYAGVED